MLPRGRRYCLTAGGVKAATHEEVFQRYREECRVMAKSGRFSGAGVLKLCSRRASTTCGKRAAPIGGQA